MEADLDQVQQERLMQWCVDVLGPCELLSEDKRIHGRSGVHRIGAASGRYYLKIYREASPWELEVHCYEQWAQAFGNHAPRLIALHEEAPLAILVSELPGEILLKADLSPEQERRVWTAAGQALANLHNLTTGVHFGPCHRDGSVVGRKISDAVQYVSAEFARLIAAGSKGGYLTAEELAVIREVDAMLPAFVGERPVPCHRDYGPDNWSVTSEGAWSGVIDFEFAYDLRAADFSRYPHWEWIRRPDLLEAFFAGYGRPLTAQEEVQCMALRIQYALGAIVWGRENSFFGFEGEGREALRHIARLL